MNVVAARFCSGSSGKLDSYNAFWDVGVIDGALLGKLVLGDIDGTFEGTIIGVGGIGLKLRKGAKVIGASVIGGMVPCESDSDDSFCPGMYCIVVTLF